MTLKRLILTTGCLFLLTACMSHQSEQGLAPNKDQNQSLELSKLKANSGIDQQPANKAKNILSKYDEVQSVRAVNHDQQLLIAVKLNHHDRFRLDDIERDLRKKIKKDFSKMDVTLSTDEKIHMEVKKLEKSVQNNNLTKKELKAKIKKIKKLSTEKT